MHPIQEPRNSGLLRVSDIHEIYWEESGNPDGHPVIFLHGGPGAGASPACRGFFNPEHFRIVIIDQRGCGRSKPYACIEDNTTWDLIADTEKIHHIFAIIVQGRYDLCTPMQSAWELSQAFPKAELRNRPSRPLLF